MIVLDTNILVWLTTSPENISPLALKMINKFKTRKELYVSSISVWEIALLVKKKRLLFNIGFEEWLLKVKNLTFLKFVDVDVDIAVASVNLKWTHKDPADRFIVATALNLEAKLITSDRKILTFKGVQSIW